ncbi:hypothetical protein [Haloarchaeobius sp. HRN-SO-5]|uniref:hypothetical protein n=1 Tax=Haloarchaeobius sp. HRN-SO-5 TaxID=3446118 RepID=UPI003EBA2683
MPTDTNQSVLDRLWSRLEDRYGTDDVGCRCDASGEAQSVLDRTSLTRDDVAAYQRGERTMADLTAKLDVDLDPDRIDDARTLFEELAAAFEASDGQTPSS